MSQIMLAVPVVVLYLLSMLVALIFARRRKRSSS
jgi:Sec-independent protein secretion pathway component TatC